MNLTPNQLDQLQSLGVTPTPKKSYLPLLSISGLTFLSFGGLVLFKTQETASTPQVPAPTTLSPQMLDQSPTQVPKSIQHYLLASQQYFTQAVSDQTQKNSTSAVQNLNQSVQIATEAINDFPNDFRAYEQRGRIYLSLIDSQPQFISTAIADLTQASSLNPNSAEITRTLATLYAKKGDAQNTLNYLNKTINLQPTVAQNFYDLARLQRQIGLLSDALSTYNRLITLVSDPTQKSAVETEKSAIQQLIAQNPNSGNQTSQITPSVPVNDTVKTEGPLLQADTGTGLIIAAPETAKDITVKNLSTSNSLSGSAILPSGTASITIPNSQLTSSSQVYITATKGGKNQTLQVLSKSKDSFSVGLSSPINENIEFTWWIVN